MIKKTLLILAFLFSMAAVYGQQTIGQWKIYPTVGKSYDKIIDSKDKVYFLTAASIYSYDKKSNETYFYDSSNKLSGSNVKDMFYNYDDNYLIIVYNDNNMDMLYDNGDCYCLPEIKDANLTDDKTINDVDFGKGRIFVATNFGLVIYDAKRREVIESGIYRLPIQCVTVAGDKVIISSPSNMYFADVEGKHNTISKFVNLGETNVGDLYGVNDNMVAWVNSKNNTLMISTINYQNAGIENVSTNLKVTGIIVKYNDGFYIRSSNKIILYNDNAKQTGSFVIPAELVNEKLAFFDGKESVWLGGEKGSANYDFSSSTPTVISDWYSPESVTCKEISFLIPSANGERIYISNLGPSNLRGYLPGYPDAANQRQYTNVIENGKITDVSVVKATGNVSSTYQKSNNNTAMYGGMTRLVGDPVESDKYYIGNGQDGLYVVKGNEELWRFDINNAPFKTYWNSRTRIFDVNFDPDGNMWVGMMHNNSDYPPYIILPAKKLRQDFNQIKNEDWIWANIPEYSAYTKDFQSLFSKVSNMAFFCNALRGIYVVDTKGTYDNVADDETFYFSTLTDQDGNNFQPQAVYSMIEDMKGRVWIGTDLGPFYFPNPKAIKSNTTVVRPKVPRNDGTNYADFLLDTDIITAMAVDHSDRKWIATDLSGVYLVSENGDKILKHYDTTNSPLPTNRVTSVACDKNTNTVYFGTMTGLLSYKSDSSPAKDDYSEVYAYPNPVRPDYTGWITVAGLMENSLVKIADANGNVFYQGRSEGGMITWDGCNSVGERVRSGVYYVYASTDGEGNSSNSVVTKIMVIK